jgi:hypothetical protein
MQKIGLLSHWKADLKRKEAPLPAPLRAENETRTISCNTLKNSDLCKTEKTSGET